MKKMIERLWIAITKKPEINKVSGGKLAGRLLLGFFCGMILLTMVSRAADSITVAKIEVATGNPGRLNYIVKGNGTLVEKSEKYLGILEGVRIVAIYAKNGEYVEEGAPLFQYDTIGLEDRIDDLEDDLRKTEIAAEINSLNSTAETETSRIRRAELTLERAELDQKSAKEDLEDAIETVKEKKIDEYEDAKELYEEAKETRNEQAEARDKAIEDANEKVIEAKDNLNELYEDKVNAQTVISNYKIAVENPSGDALLTAETNIYKLFYGGEKEYEEHTKKVKQARKAVNRAEEDYSNAEAEKGDELTHSEKTMYSRAIRDAEEELEALTKKDVELQNAIITYNNAVRNNSEELMEKAYQVLFDLLYEEDKNKKKQIEEANKALTDSQDDYAETQDSWEKIMAEEEEKVQKSLETFEEAELIYLDIVSDSYDYSQDVKTEEAAVERATRAVEDARLDLEDAKKADSNTQAKDQSNQKITNLNEESAMIDIKEKQEALNVVKEIMKNEGKVLSPVSGVVSKLELEVGNNTSGTEKFAITTGNYGFVAAISKEDAKHLSLGDEMVLAMGNNNDKITVTIETIGLEDSDGQVEITGMLPKDQYIAGSVVEYKIQKQSESFDTIIPIQALRMDAKGRNYVLVTREKNTVLGNELTAFRVDINVIDKDGVSVAVEGGLLPDDNLIVSSSKYIEEGDRVRINESNLQ